MVGNQIRALRTQAGMSMRQVAGRAGISVGLLSQVERGLSDPSLQTLRRIARTLHTPLFNLFHTPEESTVALVRADRRMCVRSPHGELTYTRISPGAGKLEVLEGLLQPGASSSAEAWSHPSEECAVVTSGELVVEIEDDEHRLAVGDSCYFDSRLPHRYRNDTEEHTTFMLSVTPPSY